MSLECTCPITVPCYRHSLWYERVFGMTSLISAYVVYSPILGIYDSMNS